MFHRDIANWRRLGVAALAAALVAPAALAQETAPATRSDLMPARKIVQKSIESMGGKAAFEKIQSAHIVAAMSADTPMGPMDIDMDMYVARPDRFFLRRKMGQFGEMTEGSDGKTAWMHNPMMGGYQLIEEPEEIEGRYKQAAIYDMIVRLEADFPGLETVDRRKFQDQDCWKIKAVDESGEPQFVFFNTETSRLVGVERESQTPMGPQTATIVFSDWKPVGDLQLYTRMNIEQGPTKMTMDLKEITFNDVDTKVFDLPDEVAKIAAAKATMSPAQPTSQPEGR